MAPERMFVATESDEGRPIDVDRPEREPQRCCAFIRDFAEMRHERAIGFERVGRLGLGGLGVPLVPDRLREGVGKRCCVQRGVGPGSHDHRTGTEVGEDVGDGPFRCVRRSSELIGVETADDGTQTSRRHLEYIERRSGHRCRI